jgi:uncharacterized spore protein YtfJ
MPDNLSFSQNIETLFSDLHNFVKTDSVIGEPVNVGDKTLVPLMSVTLGYGSTGMGKMPNNNTNISTGLGLGARISTNAVMVIEKDGVSMLPVSEKSTMGQLMDKIPQALSSMGQNMMQQGMGMGQNTQGQQQQNQTQTSKSNQQSQEQSK